MGFSGSQSQRSLTPAMRQYMELKRRYPDAVLLFRMGDFYETFFEDAQLCSRVLGIALTSRNKDSDQPIPLAGVPYHAVDNYLRKLVQMGYHVAICEQMEDPRQARGVVKRDVVRVVTPGTLTEDSLLEQGKDNYLAAVCLDGRQAGLAWVDLSTGYFCVQQLAVEAVLDELIRISPAECLWPQQIDDAGQHLLKGLSQVLQCSISYRPISSFEPHHAEQVLLRHFRTATLAGFGFERMDASLQAAAAVIEYLNETQKAALNHIWRLHRVSRSDYLQMDQATLRSLEIERTLRTGQKQGTLLAAVDHTVTPMGSRLLRRWLLFALVDRRRISERHDAVEALLTDRHLLAELRTLLKEVRDIERITARIVTGRANPRDVLALGRSLQVLPRVAETLKRLPARPALLEQIHSQLGLCNQLQETTLSTLQDEVPVTVREGGIIRDGVSSELDRLRTIGRDGKSWLGRYQAEQIRATGIANLKVGYNQVFGYYIEVSRANAGKVPSNYIRRQTLKNAERYITEELKSFESQVLQAADRANELEYELFEQLRRYLADNSKLLQRTAEAVAALDVLCSNAQLARIGGYCRPELLDEPVIEMRDSRHPVLAEILRERFVPNDVHLGGKHGELAIITGPNMAGKSTYIRQVALLVLLAQSGSFIPASSARIGVVDRIFARVGSADELAAGQSTFMVEMVETANILHNATPRSLVILDEIGRGTSTFDGLALAWAVSERLARSKHCRTLFATHYHELTELAGLFENIRNYNVAVREWQDEIVFLYRVVPGGADKSYGIHVARLAGVPADVLQRAREVLAELEKQFRRELDSPQMRSAAPRSPDGQLLLFEPANHPVLEQLQQIELERLTPIDALNLLKQLQQQLRSER